MGGIIIFGSEWAFCPVLEAGKMYKDLNEFDKGQIMMARQMGQSIS